MKCRKCDKEVGQATYCEDHRWTKRNKKAVQAHMKIHRHPERIMILFECSCDNPRKHYHHPDYDKPYEVERLCPKCHFGRHKAWREEDYRNWVAEQRLLYK